LLAGTGILTIGRVGGVLVFGKKGGGGKEEVPVMGISRFLFYGKGRMQRFSAEDALGGNNNCKWDKLKRKGAR